MESTNWTRTDALSRETTLAEGQVEDMHDTAATTDGGTHQPSISPSSHDANADPENDAPDEPYHPSDPGAHKPPGAAGYEHLAEFMAETQTGMVRKYKDLSMLNLLYLQAEIHELRKEWNQEVAADARAGLDDSGREVEGEGEEEEHPPGERRVWDYHWAAMAAGRERGLGGRRWEVWLRMRRVLGEYCGLYFLLGPFPDLFHPPRRLPD